MMLRLQTAGSGVDSSLHLETKLVGELGNLVRLRQIEGAGFRLVVDSDAKNSRDVTEVLQLEAACGASS